MQTSWQDVRYGIRMLAKNPGFTAVAILTLALGIGANTAIFSAVNTILLRPLPYRDSSRLVDLSSRLPYFPDFRLGQSNADYTDIKAGNHVFEKMAAYRSDTMNLTGEGEPEEISVCMISADLFPLLGVRPAIGRPFAAEDEQPEKGNVAILSDALWHRRFGAAPNALGRNIKLDEKLYQIVGVMPPDFRFPDKMDFWIPLALTDMERNDRMMHGTPVVARLKPGVGLPQAQAEMTTIAERLSKDYPDVDQGIGLSVQMLQEGKVARARPALLVLLGAVGFVLLIACSNVGNLALARGLKRQKEMGIRAALGASRRRILRLLLAESFLLAFAGGIVGLLFAWWGIDALRIWAPVNTPRLDELRVEPGILFSTLVLSTLAGILFGLFPALQSSSPDLNAALKEGGAAGSTASRRSYLQNALVIAEMALALVLLVGSALTIQSFARLTHVNPGFRTDHLLTMNVQLPEAKYSGDAQRISFLDQTLEKLKSLSGVESVSASSSPVLWSRHTMSTVTIEGAAPTSKNAANTVQRKSVTPDFFQTMGMRLLMGRGFDRTDVAGTLRVAVVNEAMMRRYWPDGNVVGKRISTGEENGQPVWLEVVGLVNDARDISLSVAPKPEVYLSFSQGTHDSINIYLRTSQDPTSLASAAESQIWAIDRDQPVASLSTMEVAVAENVAEPRFRTALLGLFAGLGLTLTVIGIYGVISYAVSQRTHEIGIRMALGAEPRDVLRHVLWGGLKLTLAGLGIGLIAALALTRLLASLLFEIRATDPVTFAGVTALLVAVAMAACYFPARRATKVDPLVALRHE